MAAQKGRDALLKINTTGSTYATVGGAQEITVTIANEAVDVTNADDAGIRKLLEGAGTNSVSIKFKGIYVDDTYIATLRQAALTNAHKMMQVSIPGTTPKVYQGSFMIASFEESTKFNGAIEESLTLESAGAITLA